jgi:hypothetical protein
VLRESIRRSMNSEKAWLTTSSKHESDPSACWMAGVPDK